MTTILNISKKPEALDGKWNYLVGMLNSGITLVAKFRTEGDNMFVTEVIRIHESLDGRGRVVAQPMADPYFGIDRETTVGSFALWRQLDPDKDSDHIRNYEEYWSTVRARRAGLTLSTNMPPESPFKK